MSDVTSSDARDESSVLAGALRTTLGFVTVWSTLVLVGGLVPLAVAMGWFGALSEAIGQRYGPGSLVANLDVSFRSDHAPMLDALEASSSSMLAVLGFTYLLGGVFRSGGWLQVLLQRRHGRSLRRFFFGGGRYFFRFLRVAIGVVLLLALVNWVLEGLPAKRLVDEGLLGLGSDGALEDLGSEQTVVWRTWALALVGFVATALIFAWAQYTRTRIALQDSSSAFVAGALTVWLLIRHPVRTLRPLVGIFLIEVLLLAGLAWAVSSIEGGLDAESTWVAIAGLFALSCLTLAAREILRGARYAASVRVSADLLRQPIRPDPWNESLGGPGGPRYPIDTGDGDEYGVSL